MGINANAYTIYPENLNDYRREILRENEIVIRRAGGLREVSYGDAFTGNHLYRDIQEKLAEQNNGNGGQQDMARFLQELSMLNAGRGVNKMLQTPAQLNGFNPQNPQFFNMQPKQPVPYQKMIANKHNLQAVLKGFQENRGTTQGGPSPSDTANIIVNVERNAQLFDTVFNKQKTDSIYAGVPKSTAQNLYQINLNKIRRDSIYALQ